MTFFVTPAIVGIDLWEAGQPYRTCAYVILAEEPTLIETGSAKSHDVLWEGLHQAGVREQDLRHVVITHVHLDHAGGVGQTMARAPQARLHCHPRALRHVVDPSRLWQGATAVYGERLSSLFGPVMPVAPERVQVQSDLTRLTIGPGRELVFYDTPGHARHHVCVLDERSQGLFSGDMVGIRYQPEWTGWDFVYGFPSTTPSDFDPEAMRHTLKRLAAQPIARIYHTHYGMTEPASEALGFAQRGLDVIKEMLPQLSPDSDPPRVQALLESAIFGELARAGRRVADLYPLALDLWLNSQGIVAYLRRLAGSMA